MAGFGTVLYCAGHFWRLNLRYEAPDIRVAFGSLARKMMASLEIRESTNLSSSTGDSGIVTPSYSRTTYERPDTSWLPSNTSIIP